MERVSILFKPTTAETQAVSSRLVSVNGYLVYSDSIGGGVVDEFTVREFLDDPSNENLAVSFFEFLQENTSKSEFTTIFQDSKVLASTFNTFYAKTVLADDVAGREIVNANLTGSFSAHTFSSLDFVSDSTRSGRETTVLSFFNTGQSYYIPVLIGRDVGRIETDNFSRFHKDVFGEPQRRVETVYRRFTQKEVLSMPNPANVITEYQSFKGPLIGRSGVVAFKFKTSGYVVGQSEGAGVIPIDIVFQEPVPFEQTIYMLFIASATTAVFGRDFDMNDTSNPNRFYKKFLLNAGDTGVTTNVRVFESFKSNMSAKIELALSTAVVGEPRGGNVTTVMVPDQRRFGVINEQPPITQEVFTDVNETVITSSVRRQKLLQGFVDANFNDNETEFWRNENVKVTRIAGLSPPMAESIQNFY